MKRREVVVDLEVQEKTDIDVYIKRYCSVAGLILAVRFAAIIKLCRITAVWFGKIFKYEVRI